MSEENKKEVVIKEPQIKEHKFSLMDSFFEFAVLIVGILYTVWNGVDVIDAIADKAGLSVIIGCAFDMVAKAVPFIILLFLMECHEKLSYIEDNLSETTDYIVGFNEHLEDEIDELFEALEDKGK